MDIQPLAEKTDQNDIKNRTKEDWQQIFRKLKIPFFPLKNSPIEKEAKEPQLSIGDYMEGEISNETLTTWFVSNLDGFNSGLPCGNQFDAICFQLDEKDTDPASHINRFLEHIPELKIAPIIRTGDGGYQIYAKILNQPEQGALEYEINDSFSFSIKTKGDYVVAPGSVICGNKYELISGDFENIPAIEWSQMPFRPKSNPENTMAQTQIPRDDGTSTLNGFRRERILEQMQGSVSSIEAQVGCNQKIQEESASGQDPDLFEPETVKSPENDSIISIEIMQEKPLEIAKKADENLRPVEAQNLERNWLKRIYSIIELIEKNRWSDTEVINTIFEAIKRDIRYCPDISKFLYYDQTAGKWKIDTRKAIAIKNLLQQEIKQILNRVEIMRTEAGRNPSKYQKYSNYIKTISRCLNGSKLKSLAECLEMNRNIHAQLNEFDRDPEILCVENGVVNLRTTEFYPHSPEYFHRNQAAVTYDPEATCPRFMQFLNEVFNADQDMINYIQRVIGHAFTGFNDQKKFYFNYGLTNNGKSVFFNVVKNIAGDYAATVRETALSKSNDYYGDKANPEIKKLQGKRIAVLSEYSGDTRLNTALLKDLTGGDKISMRNLHENGCEFESTAKLFFYSNHKPQFSEYDAGIKDRLSFIQWNVVIPEEQRDKYLSEKLKKEYSGILNWILEGSRRYFTEGIKVPESLNFSNESDEKVNADAFGAWISSCVQLVDDSEMTTEELYRSYTQFSRENPGNNVNAKVLDKAGFGRKLSSLGLEKRKFKSKDGGMTVENRGFKGIALN